MSQDHPASHLFPRPHHFLKLTFSLPIIHSQGHIFSLPIFSFRMSFTQASTILWPHLLPAQYPSLGTHIFLGPSSPREHFHASPHHFLGPPSPQGMSSPKVISSPDPIFSLGSHLIPKPHHFLGPTFCLAIIHP